MSEDNVVIFRPPKGKGLSRESLPPDIRDATNYIIDRDTLGSGQLANEARKVVNDARCYSLGHAVEVLSQRRSDMKLNIRMPEPRGVPWKMLPALLVGGRPAPGAYVSLTPKQHANVLELLKLLGFRNGNPPEQLKGLGGGWMTDLGLKLERARLDSDPSDDNEPDFTEEELRARLKRARRPPPGWAWPPDLVPNAANWIMFGDRLPPVGKRVLVMCGTKSGRVQEDELEDDEIWNWKFNARMSVAWAELPE